MIKCRYRNTLTDSGRGLIDGYNDGHFIHALNHGNNIYGIVMVSSGELRAIRLEDIRLTPEEKA